MQITFVILQNQFQLQWFLFQLKQMKEGKTNVGEVDTFVRTDARLSMVIDVTASCSNGDVWSVCFNKAFCQTWQFVLKQQQIPTFQLLTAAHEYRTSSRAPSVFQWIYRQMEECWSERLRSMKAVCRGAVQALTLSQRVDMSVNDCVISRLQVIFSPSSLIKTDWNRFCFNQSLQ